MGTAGLGSFLVTVDTFPERKKNSTKHKQSLLDAKLCLCETKPWLTEQRSYELLPSSENLEHFEGTKADWKDFQSKASFFCFPPSFIFLSSPTSFLSRSHSEPDCHENELLICSPKEFLVPRRPDSRNTTLVMWSTNNFPGLHCLSKTLFPADADHGRNDLVKGRPAFIPAQRCQMGRVRTSKHVNPRRRRLGPSSPPSPPSPRHSWFSVWEVSPQSTFQSPSFTVNRWIQGFYHHSGTAVRHLVVEGWVTCCSAGDSLQVFSSPKGTTLQLTINFAVD